MGPLRWHEPSAYRRAVARRRDGERPWEEIKVALTVFFAIIAVHVLSGFARPDANRLGWPAILALASAVALLIAFGLPRMLLLLPNSIVILSEKGINNNIIGPGSSICFWPWEEISSGRIATMTLGGRDFLTLRFYGLDGQGMATFGLKDELMIEEIEQMFASHGKRFRVGPD